jgi:hypothetical protein
VSPDGTAFKCWRDGGKVHQATPNKTGGYQKSDDYGKHVKPKAKQPTFTSAAEAIAAYRKGSPAATWCYHYARGEEVLVIARWERPAGGKDIRPAGRVDAGWIMGDPQGPFPLYRLPAILAADPGETIHVCEGEKATDAAVSIGLLATTSAHGSCSSAKTDWTPLAGRDVVILPDNDEPGAKYASNVATILAELDPPATVRVVDLPGLPPGGDIVDYLEPLDSKEPDDLRRGIMALAANAVPAKVECSGPIVTCLADVQFEPISWLWKGRIALGRITLLVGAPGCGKSYLTCYMAARVSTGSPWPDGTPCEGGGVILITAEDGLGDTIRPRLEAHHADLTRIHHFSVLKRPDEYGRMREIMFDLSDVRTLEETLKRVPDCRLIVIDPIGSFLGGRTNSDKDNEVRSILAPVARIAERCGAALLIVAHRRKSSGSTADELALGSRAFTGIARAVWHLSRDKDNKERRLFLPGKNNLAPEGTGLAFTIQGLPTGAIAWERDPVTMTADEAVASEAGESHPGPEPEARKEAEEWLTELLAAGPVASDKVKAEAKAAGMKWATVRRAKDTLRIKARKCRFTGGWEWHLAKALTKVLTPEQGVEPEQHEHLGSTPRNIGVPSELAREGAQVLTQTTPEHLGGEAGRGQGQPVKEPNGV